MPLHRISIKMNAWDYDYLFRLQETAILVGCKFNDAPPLNEIVRGLIRYVRIKIKESNQAAFEFRKSMDLFSEIPHEVYERMKESAASIPTAEGGSYIFMASEEDISGMDDIIKIVQPDNPSKEASYPSIIRNAIRHVLGKEGLLLRENKQKFGFVGLAILSALYKIKLDHLVSLALDPSFNIRDLPFDSRNKIDRMGSEYTNLSRYISTFVHKESNGSVAVSSGSMDPEKYYDLRKEFRSLIGDFNYVDMFTGLVISAYAWEFDTSSIPYILNSLIIVGPVVHDDSKIRGKRVSSKNGDHETSSFPTLYGAFHGACVFWITAGLLPMMKAMGLKAS